MGSILEASAQRGCLSVYGVSITCLFMAQRDMREEQSRSLQEDETVAGHAGPRQGRVSTPGLTVDSRSSTSQSRPE